VFVIIWLVLAVYEAIPISNDFDKPDPLGAPFRLLFGECESLENELLALPAVIIFMAVLVLHRPFSQADDKNPERFVFGPETVSHTGVHHELFVGFGLVDFAIDLQERPIVDEVEEFGADLVRVEARPATGLHVR
jgi:hypothetical protein